MGMISYSYVSNIPCMEILYDGLDSLSDEIQHLVLIIYHFLWLKDNLKGRLKSASVRRSASTAIATVG